MHIYLIRHTTPDIELDHCYGQSDIDVKDSFNDEVSRIKNILPELNSVQVFSSPLQRCHKLANALQIGKVQTDNRLKEINFGEWELKKWKDIAKEEFDFWIEDFVNRRAADGECYRDVSKRMVGFLNDAIKMDYENIVIVSHGGSLRTLFAHISEAPLKNLFRINIDFGSVSRLSYENNKFKIDFINR
ncbi:MAG: alpha-ribazole phosphatase [Calditrichae bacterium]|nr:alpha-ribazole phosphatase [Calditrichota bacterium]MCB9058457.1 alpha-ribazole phosphatase [Calditrichia bacterium]